MKRWIIWCLSVLLLCSIPLGTVAASASGAGFLIEDKAGYLSDNEELVLENHAESLYMQNGLIFGIFTVETIGENTAEQYLTKDKAFREMKDRNIPYVVTILISDTGKISAYSGNGAETVCTDTVLNDMLYYGIARIGDDGSAEPMYRAFVDYLGQQYGTVDHNVGKMPAANAVPDAYLIDDAELLSDTEETLLNDRITELRETYGQDIVIVTTDDTNGKSAMDYADDYFDYHGYTDNGVLLLIDMGNREWWISTEGSCIDALNDKEIQTIGKEVAKGLKAKNYFEACNDFLKSVDQELKQFFDTIESVYGESSFGYAIKQWWNGISWSTVLIAVGIAILIAFIAVSILKAGMKTARMKPYAREYVREGSFHLTYHSDIFLYSNTTKRYIQPANHSSGSGGGSTHRSSSGDRHGGGGGKF